VVCVQGLCPRLSALQYLKTSWLFSPLLYDKLDWRRTQIYGSLSNDYMWRHTLRKSTDHDFKNLLIFRPGNSSDTPNWAWRKGCMENQSILWMCGGIWNVWVPLWYEYAQSGQCRVENKGCRATWMQCTRPKDAFYVCWHRHTHDFWRT
jgi:hypothetical protein